MFVLDCTLYHRIKICNNFVLPEDQLFTLLQLKITVSILIITNAPAKCKRKEDTGCNKNLAHEMFLDPCLSLNELARQGFVLIYRGKYSWHLCCKNFSLTCTYINTLTVVCAKSNLVLTKLMWWNEGCSKMYNVWMVKSELCQWYKGANVVIMQAVFSLQLEWSCLSWSGWLVSSYRMISIFTFSVSFHVVVLGPVSSLTMETGDQWPRAQELTRKHRPRKGSKIKQMLERETAGTH